MDTLLTGSFTQISPNPFKNNERLELVRKHILPELMWETF
jgi:hypothetical protein